MFGGPISHQQALFTSHKVELRNNRGYHISFYQICLCLSAVIVIAIQVIKIVMITIVSSSSLMKLAFIIMVIRFPANMIVSLFLLKIFSQTRLEILLLLLSFFGGFSTRLKLEGSTDILLRGRFYHQSYYAESTKLTSTSVL